MALNPPNDKPGILKNTNPYFLLLLLFHLVQKTQKTRGKCQAYHRFQGTYESSSSNSSSSIFNPQCLILLPNAKLGQFSYMIAIMSAA